jgi:hypothetical protein
MSDYIAIESTHTSSINFAVFQMPNDPIPPARWGLRKRPRAMKD